MANKYIRGYSEKQIFRNEKYTRGVISTKDPLQEGSFRRLINFDISNQGASLSNREPFLTVPLFDKSNREVKLSSNAFVFTLNDSTEYAYILDLKQDVLFFEDDSLYSPINVMEFSLNENDNYVVDGDTLNLNGKRYRLALIDAPELNDETFEPINLSISELDKNKFKDMGNQAKKFTEKELSGVESFKVVQYPFQSELTDEFGRDIVFVEYVKNGEKTFLNYELFRYGLAMFYGQTNFENNQDYVLPLVINNTMETNDTEYPKFNLWQKFFNSYDIPDIPTRSEAAFSETYTGNRIKIVSNNLNYKYDKPVIYKIKKETDLLKSEINDKNHKIIKRVLETIEINELLVKQDLEISNDSSLKYVIESKDFTVINGKYADQYVNFFVSVLDIFGKNIYKGLIELTHSNENLDEGIRETFKLRTYNKPEAHIELQDLTNYKPNILDSKSIIPKTYTGKLANSKGFTSPSVDAVVVSADFDYDLKISKEENEEIIEKYFQTNSLIYNDLRYYTITPFYKAPIIPNKEGQDISYMYRWDIVDLKEIDLDKIDESEPFFRSAWTDLYTGESISDNKTREKGIMLNIKNIASANDIYIITTGKKRDFYYEENSEQKEWSISTDEDIKTEQEAFDELLEKSIDQIKTSIKDYEVFKLGKEETIELKRIISNNKKEDSISLKVDKTTKGKLLSPQEIGKLLTDDGKEKKIAFVFLPIEVEINDTEKNVKHYTYNSFETRGIFFNFRKKENYKTILPTKLNIEQIIRNDLIKVKFFKEGIQATFYLMTYDKNKLNEMNYEDEFYDNLAYRKTSATYVYAKAKSSYKRSDFIVHELKKESEAIQKCKYITSHEDKIITYGSPEFLNTIFISEEGSPYYFALASIFEFDHQVVHVQSFKNILLVFTINDIWVIYQIEEDASYKEQEGNTINATKMSYRYKKILYNISTEEKNKPTIKNITRYITLMSNDVLYLIKPSTFIADETEFSLNILSKNVDSIVKDPLAFINERLKYYEIFEEATSYKMNLNATDNYIKLYYSSTVGENNYTLILTYDILNNRWYEEDTTSFGYPERIYLLDSSTGYEMLTNSNEQLYLTYQTDKYKNLLLSSHGENYYDLSVGVKDFEIIDKKNPIKYYIDTGYLKLNEHFKKRFKSLLYTIKNIDSKKITFSYNFTIDDRQFHSNVKPSYRLNSNNQIIYVLEENVASEINGFENFKLDFSNLETGDIVTAKQPLLGSGRLPRLQMSFTTSNRFYILSYGIIYSEQGSKNI